MRFLRTPTEPVIAEQTPVDEPLNIAEFLTANERAISESTENWATAYETLHRWDDNRDYLRATREGVEKVCHDNRQYLPVEIDRAASEFRGDLNEYTRIAARVRSVTPAVDRPRDQAESDIRSIADTDTLSILWRSGFPRKKYIASHVILAENIRHADHASNTVLDAFLRYSAKNPDCLKEFADLCEARVDQTDPRFAELRMILSADWHNSNPLASKLRQYYSRLEQEPRLYAPSFGNAVAHAKGETHALRQVREIAAYATWSTVCGPDEPLPDQIAAHLGSTYDRWSDYDVIASVFKGFVRARIGADRALVDTIASVRQSKNIRFHPTEKEILDLQRNFRIRTHNGRKGKAPASQPRATTVEPAYDSNRKHVGEPEREILPKTVYIAKQRLQGRLDLIETAPSEMAACFKVDSPELETDVEKMINWIIQNPISKASLILSGNDNTVRISGKKCQLWRFAPDDAPATLKINGNNRYTRIVYALTSDKLVIFDILPHDEFTKKYAS